MIPEKISASSLKGSSLQAIERRGGLLEKKYKLKDTAVESTNYHYWRQKRFLDTIEPGKRASLNLVECIWIEILISLKKFGCSAKTMEMAYKALFLDAYSDNLSKIFRDGNLKHFQKLKSTRPLTPDEETFLAVLEQTATDEKLSSHFRREISYLYHMIIEILEYNAEAGIIITEDGKCNRYIRYPEAQADLSSSNFPHIKIPIANYLEKFFEKDTRAENLNITGVLTDTELSVVKQMRNNNIRSVKVHFRHNDHSIEKIELEEKGLLNEEKSKEIMGIMGMKNYSKIELNTRDGQQLSFTRTTKKYF